nr:penicillin-binding transpeptidase domain-containing protein [Streptosporangium nondiastaticum]
MTLYDGDDKVSLQTPEGPYWDRSGKIVRAVNDGDRSWGKISLKDAVAQSVNTPMMQLGMDVGLDRAGTVGVQAGLLESGLGEKLPSFSLGTSTPSAIRMADAYATFAAKGRHTEPYSVAELRRNGDDVPVGRPQPEQALPPHVAGAVDEALREAVRDGTAKPAQGAAAPECRGGLVHCPGTYMAGCHDRVVSSVAGRQVENEDMVNLPNWLLLRFRLLSPDGSPEPWFTPDTCEVTDYRQAGARPPEGTLPRAFRYLAADGRVLRVEQCRLVHMGDPHIAALRTVFVPEGWDGRIEAEAGLDGNVINADVHRYRALDRRRLAGVQVGVAEPDTVWLRCRTRTSEIGIGMAQRAEVTGRRRRYPGRRRWGSARSTTTCGAPATAPPSARSSTAGSWPAPAARTPGGTSAKHSKATSRISRAAPRRKASTSAPWPAPSTSSSAA